MKASWGWGEAIKSWLGYAEWLYQMVSSYLTISSYQQHHHPHSKEAPVCVCVYVCVCV